jgi:hypothetical protein
MNLATQLTCLALLLSGTQVSANAVEEHPPLLDNSRFTVALKRFREPALWSLEEKAESYRIYVDNPIVSTQSMVRLDRLSAKRWRLTTKTRYRSRLQTWTRYLTNAEVEEAITRLNDTAFWQLSGHLEFVGHPWCFDEPYWIIEARVAGRYHGSGIQLCGRDAVFVPAGIALLRLTGRSLGLVGSSVSETEVWPK